MIVQKAVAGVHICAITAEEKKNKKTYLLENNLKFHKFLETIINFENEIQLFLKQ